MRIAMLLHKSAEFDSRVRREAAALVEAGHQVTVVELAPLGDRPAALDGFDRRSAELPPWVRRALPFHLYRIAFLARFIRAIAALRPDVVHAHDAAMLLPGLVGATLTRARLVYDAHELATSVPYRERAWTWFVAAVERLIVPRAAAVITVSPGIADRLQTRYRLPRKPTVLRNVSALLPGGEGGLRQLAGVGNETPLVLHQGAPAPDRGCDVLVEAAALLDEVHVAFLGDPEPGYGLELQTRIRSLNLDDRVRLLPSVPLDHLLSYTAEADLGVTLLQDTCENHRLALPNKLFEYIAADVPVVASDLPEVARLVAAYEIGECALPHDPLAVAQAIAKVLAMRGDPGLQARLRRAAQDLRWERERTRLLELYDRLD